MKIKGFTLLSMTISSYIYYMIWIILTVYHFFLII